jgi:hypothetical protein
MDKYELGKSLLNRKNRAFVEEWVVKNHLGDGVMVKSRNSAMTKTVYVLMGDLQYALCDVYHNGYIDFIHYDKKIFNDFISFLSTVDRKRKISLI